jgi:hypothetical protein
VGVVPPPPGSPGKQAMVSDTRSIKLSAMVNTLALVSIVCSPFSLI